MKSMEVFSELRKEGTCCCVMVRLQVSWLPAVRAVTQLRNRLLHCRIYKSLTTSFWGLFWFCHCDIWSLRNLVVSLLTIFVLKPCTPYYSGYLKLVTLYRVQKSKQRINWFWPLGWKQVFSLRACRLIYLESMTKSTTGMVTAVSCEQNKW